MLVCSNSRRLFVDLAKMVVVDVKVRRQVRDGWAGARRGIVAI